MMVLLPEPFGLAKTRKRRTSFFLDLVEGNLMFGISALYSGNIFAFSRVIYPYHPPIFGLNYVSF